MRMSSPLKPYAENPAGDKCCFNILIIFHFSIDFKIIFYWYTKYKQIKNNPFACIITVDKKKSLKMVFTDWKYGHKL